MPRYVIEREIPGAGNFTRDDLRRIAQKSCKVLDALGSSIRWIESYVTGDKLYCIYDAKDEGLIRRHAEEGGFPADSVAKIRAMIEPATADGKAIETAP